MNNNYNWTDNPTVSGVALCDTDVLNDCLMHLKYDNESGSGFSLFDIVAKDHVLSAEESKGFAALGSYVYKESATGRYGYPDFYNKCVEEKNNSEVSIIIQSPIENVPVNPIMTSNTTPSGECTSTGTKYDSSPSYFAFRELPVSLAWTSSSGSVSYQFADGEEPDANNTYKVSLNYGSYNAPNRSFNNATITITYIDNSTKVFNLGSLTGTINSVDSTKETDEFVASKKIKTITFSHSGSAVSTTTMNVGNIRLIKTAEGKNLIYKNSNGHQFYDVADKNIIDEWYNNTGVAWYYGIDTENERIFLPRNDWFFQNGNSQNVGSFIEAGLPNITGNIAYHAWHSVSNGAFYTNSSVDNTKKSGTSNDNNSNPVGSSFDASRSNSIYGKSNTVQPPAVKAVYYMVVGNTSNVTLTTVELTSDSAEAPITFDSETNAVKLSIGDGLSVDTDGNLTGLTSQQAAHSAMPSGRVIDLTLGANGTSYTAPADGWFVLAGNPSVAGRVHMHSVLDDSRYSISNCWVSISNPIQAGHLMTLYYDGTINGGFKFVYAEGAK